jgi:hypothetical protein
MRTVTTYEHEYTKLKALFDQICSEKNWKHPIHCYIPEHTFDDYNEACIHFTGAGLSVERKSGSMYECTSPGYYAVVGA